MKRNTKGIKAWMVLNGLSNRDVAKKANAQESHTSETIHGRRDHRRVLLVLLESGCPEKLLALREDMKRKEAA